MPTRNFDSGFWTDPNLVLKLPTNGKTLFAYLFTTAHCNSAGLYYIAPETISYETGIPIQELQPLFDLIKPSVEWLQDEQLVWVKNFLDWQSRSPLYLKSVGKSLRTIHNEQAVQNLIAYNLKRFNLDLTPYYKEAKSREKIVEEEPPPSDKKGKGYRIKE